MIETNVKNNIIKILSVILIIVLNILSINNVQAANIEESSMESNYNIIENEEIFSDTIVNLILTINSEGMNKQLLTETINLYTEASKEYTNKDIANIIENNKEELKNNGVSTENINSIVSTLKKVDEEQVNKILETINIEDVLAKVENGDTIQDILENVTSNLTTQEKVSLVFDILLSANFIKAFLIGIIILFIYRTLLRCVIYKKAKRKVWAAFVPIYRNIVMLKVCNMSPWWLLLLFVPIIGWVILWLISVASKFMLAEGFGKGVGFAFGLWLLAPIFETAIVFSRKTKYIGFEEEE